MHGLGLVRGSGTAVNPCNIDHSDDDHEKSTKKHCSTVMMQEEVESKSKLLYR